MVKGIGLPARLGMASLALLIGELLLMRVLMAVYAGLKAYGLVLAPLMALLAFHLIMLYLEHIGRIDVVIELLYIFPACDVVAGIALLIAELLLMRILMAGEALLGRACKYAFLLMAFYAGYLSVLVPELIIGPVVVKLILIYDYHLVASALVVAVAFYARIRIFGMKPLLVLYLFRKLVMAVEAKAVGYAFTKTVAFYAVFYTLIFGMGFSEIARTYE